MFADTHLVLIKALWLFFSPMLLVRQSQLMISSNPAQEEESARTAASAESSLQVRRSAEPPGSGGFCPPHASLHQCRRKLGGSGVGKGREGAIIRKRARKVRTTEHGAHKFSCASAGTAVPLWTSSVLQ